MTGGTSSADFPITAGAPDLRARRADTLALARNADPIPISEAVLVAWARLVTD